MKYVKKSDANYVISGVVFSENNKKVEYTDADGTRKTTTIGNFNRYYTAINDRDVFNRDVDAALAALYTPRRLPTVPNVTKYGLTANGGNKTLVYTRTGKRTIQILFHPCDAPVGVEYNVIKYALPASLILPYTRETVGMITAIATNAAARIAAGGKAKSAAFLAAYNAENGAKNAETTTGTTVTTENTPENAK